ncbi:hypothetical protein G6011_07998 [Alternaria panax]|uniref:Uncharacterized protein n=1 Tax=Alternaria panax TaxID=48097 RepID=A0AAD4F7Z3_9PLEO|nr:hypothetical protein G6011_07998 [Alternaria panax]
MAKPPLTEKLVYLVLKDIFRGDKTQPNTREEIRKKIEKHRGDSKVEALIVKYGMESVSKVAQDLLKYQIFVSMAKAEVRFPEVFELLPTQAQRQSTSESNIATSSAVAVQSTKTYSCEELLSVGDEIRIKMGKGKERTVTKPQNRSLDSISLPLWDQHRVLVRVQYALEKTCFAFAQKTLGSVLQREGWDCAEAVELNRWPKILLSYQEECNLNSVQEVDKSLPILLDSITQLRHNAVHRVSLSSLELSQYLTDAVMLAQLLQDDGCSRFISTVRERTQDAIEEFVRNKAILDSRLADIKCMFAAKRVELDLEEATLLETAVREHKQPTISVSGSLDPLYDDLGGTDAIHDLWRHGCDPVLPDNESQGYEGNAETNLITGLPNEAEEEKEKTKEAGKKSKEDKKKGKKGKKKQREQAEKKAAEEEENTAQQEAGGELGNGAVEDIHGDVEIVEELSVHSTLVPTVASDSIEQAITGENKDAEGDKDKDQSEEEQYFECPEIMLDGHESNPNHP